MTGSSFLTSARVANSKLASITAGYRVCAGKRAGGMGKRRLGSVAVEPATLAKRNLPAIVVIRCSWRGSGAARVAAELTAPTTGHARTTAGSENSFGDRAPRGHVFLFALVKFLQEPTSGIAKAFHFLSKSMFHDRIKTHGAFTWNEKVFPNPPKVLSRVK